MIPLKLTGDDELLLCKLEKLVERYHDFEYEYDLSISRKDREVIAELFLLGQHLYDAVFNYRENYWKACYFPNLIQLGDLIKILESIRGKTIRYDPI